MLATVANRQGNLLLNIGPRGDGSNPESSARILREVGAWIREGGGAEALWGVDRFTYDYERRDGHRSDWDSSAIFTARDRFLYAILRYFPGPEFVLAGLEGEVREITVNGRALDFAQAGGKVRVSLPADLEAAFCPVLRFECAVPPGVYRTGGMRVPKVPHPPYDACPSDLVE
jgi:alpha-L-fucosidase